MSAPKKKAPPAKLTLWDDLLAVLDENDRLLREIVETARVKKAPPAELTLWEDFSAVQGEFNRLLREIVEVARAMNAKGKGMKS